MTLLGICHANLDQNLRARGADAEERVMPNFEDSDSEESVGEPEAGGPQEHIVFEDNLVQEDQGGEWVTKEKKPTKPSKPKKFRHQGNFDWFVGLIDSGQQQRRGPNDKKKQDKDATKPAATKLTELAKNSEAPPGFEEVDGATTEGAASPTPVRVVKPLPPPTNPWIKPVAQPSPPQACLFDWQV